MRRPWLRALPTRSIRRITGGMAVACAIGLVSVPGAFAEDPLRTLDGNITDQVGALDGREDEVRGAIDVLYEKHSLDLYVTYVDGFSGLTPAEWADDTAQLTALTVNDVLLAVATGEHQYAVSVDPNYPISEKQLRKIEQIAVEPALRQNDWAGAAIGAAKGFAAVRSQQPVVAPQITPGEPDPTSDDGTLTPWVVAGLAVAVVALVVLVVFRRWCGQQRANVSRS